MILRRFPWKLPDVKQDASYRLYVQSHPELCRVPDPQSTRGRQDRYVTSYEGSL